MKSIFNKADNQEILTRINTLTPHSKALWGKMSVDQMLKHINDAILVSFNEKPLKVPFVFKILGRLMKGSVLKKPEFTKNSPTAKEFKYEENFDFETIKNELISNFSRFQQGEQAITCKNHPFWGKMNGEDWNNLQWKHVDHHLRQFGV
ncbi:DUF1569 domain-containing protein [Flavobacterium facile]|uniref:DUF1569 domain-containing protein n=1 Tax=Flavobacterium facile TaxID=2893174 RepID=UPI002E77C606|nr:DUF1569 domain-containing protein [Flavobacterium sp. T-12]